VLLCPQFEVSQCPGSTRATLPWVRPCVSTSRSAPTAIHCRILCICGVFMVAALGSSLGCAWLPRGCRPGVPALITSPSLNLEPTLYPCLLGPVWKCPASDTLGAPARAAAAVRTSTAGSRRPGGRLHARPGARTREALAEMTVARC